MRAYIHETCKVPDIAKCTKGHISGPDIQVWHQSGADIQNAQQTRYKSQIIHEIFKGPILHEMYNESDTSIRTDIQVLSMRAGYSEMYKRDWYRNQICMKCMKGQISWNVPKINYQGQIFTYDTNVGSNIRNAHTVRPDIRATLFMKYSEDQIFMKCTMSQTGVSGHIFKYFQCGLDIQKCAKRTDIRARYSWNV